MLNRPEDIRFESQLQCHVGLRHNDNVRRDLMPDFQTNPGLTFVGSFTQICDSYHLDVVIPDSDNDIPKNATPPCILTQCLVLSPIAFKTTP